MASTNDSPRPFCVLTSCPRTDPSKRRFSPSGDTLLHPLCVIFVIDLLAPKWSQGVIFHKPLKTRSVDNNYKADQTKYTCPQGQAHQHGARSFPGPHLFRAVASLTPTQTTDLRLRSWYARNLKYAQRIVQFLPVISRILLNAPSSFFKTFPIWTINYMGSLIWGGLNISLKQSMLIKVLIITFLDHRISSNLKYLPPLSAAAHLFNKYY